MTQKYSQDIQPNAADDAPAEPDASREADFDGEFVSVRMFGRKYRIKSDKPDLVLMLADLVNREAGELARPGSGLGPTNYDWPVQTAFRLALACHNLRTKLARLSARVEEGAALLTARIDRELGLEPGGDSGVLETDAGGAISAPNDEDDALEAGGYNEASERGAERGASEPDYDDEKI